MRKHALMLLFLAATLYGATQTPSPTPTKSAHWSVDFLMGPAFPVGEFANQPYPNLGGGPVRTGGLAELSGTWHFNHSFGITLLTNGQLHQGNGVPIPPSSSDLRSQQVQTYTDDRWKIARLMTGGVYTIPVNSRRGMDVLIRALGGIQKTKTADYNFDTGDGPRAISYPGVSLPLTFSYQFDAGFHWRLCRRLGFIAYVGYNGCRPTKKVQYAVIYGGINGDTEVLKRTFTVPTNSILLRAGIDWSL